MEEYSWNPDPESVQQLIDVLKGARVASADLAAQGWTTPLWLIPRQTCELLGSGDPSDVDASFVRYYSSDDTAWNRLESVLSTDPGLGRWRNLLMQVLSAYERGDYVVTVPALLCVLEGVLMGDATDSTKVIKAVRAEVLKVDPESVQGWLWSAAQTFVERVFASAKFSAARPELLNRHWILHGRDISDWSQADALRLMQAIGVVASLRELRSNKRIQQTRQALDRVEGIGAQLMRKCVRCSGD